MEVRKSDSKGRVTVGEDGVTYSVHKDESGVVTLYPLQIPAIPTLGKQDLRAVYVSPKGLKSEADTVFIHSNFGSMVYLADFVAKIANNEHLPVVCRGDGLGRGLADVLAKTVDRGVIVKYPW